MWKLFRRPRVTSTTVTPTTATSTATVAPVTVSETGVQPTPPPPVVTGPSNTSWGFAPGGVVLWLSDTDLNHDLDLLAATGSKWLRFDFDWQSCETSKGSYNWSYIDRVVNGCVARGINVLATVAYTPSWARPAGTTDKTPPTDLQNYANFCTACVNRYKNRVHTWEVWNEPNNPIFWQPHPDPVAYTTMLKLAYAAIKAADPTAFVMNGGFAPEGDSAPNYYSPRTFLSNMYSNGAHGHMDAVANHPYAYNYGIDAVGDWNQWYTLDKMYAIMQANGDGALKIWGTEYGAPTGTASQAVTEAQQAQYVTDAWSEWRGKWGAFTGPLMWYSFRDDGTDLANVGNNFGLVRHDFSIKPAYTTFKNLPKT